MKAVKGDDFVPALIHMSSLTIALLMSQPYIACQGCRLGFRVHLCLIWLLSLYWSIVS